MVYEAGKPVLSRFFGLACEISNFTDKVVEMVDRFACEVVEDVIRFELDMHVRYDMSVYEKERNFNEEFGTSGF